MKKNMINSTGMLLTLMVVAAPSVAQNQMLTSPASREWLKEQKLWFTSANAAGTVFDNTTTYSNLEFGFDQQRGDFRRPQTGEKINDVNVNAEGFINLKNAFVWGEFKFTHENVKDALYNASITDPYRGEPYYTADEYASDWRNQFYHMKFRAATPVLWNHLAFGLEGVYQASIAAKQRDPRVDARFFTLELAPGVTYAFNSHHRIGTNLIYACIKEESNMTLELDQNYQTYYKLYGLGTASKNYGTGRTTNYFGNKWGFGAQYNFSNNGWEALAEATWTKHVENVEVSFTTPQKEGLVNNMDLNLNLQLLKRGQVFTHHATVGFESRRIDGIQYLSQRDATVDNAGWVVLYQYVQSKYKTTNLDASYALIRNRGDEYNWRVDLDAQYTYLNDTYLLPLSVKNSKNLNLHLELKKNFVLGDKLDSRLLVDIRGGWKNAMSGKYNYTGPHDDYITVTELESKDENYLLSDAWNVGGAFTYSQRVKSNLNVQGYAKLAYNYTHTNDFDFNHCSRLSISLGVNF